MPGFTLYLVTDRRLADLPRAVAAALAAVPPGAAAVQLREKDLSGRALLSLCRELLPICRARSAPLLVNDRIDVALAAGADGVHLGGGSVSVAEARALLPTGALVGVSVHEATEAAQGADLVVFGPVFETPGKGPPAGLEALRRASAAMPVYALGGIDAGNAGLAIEAGARGVAAIRAWLADPDPGQAAARLLRSARPLATIAP